MKTKRIYGNKMKEFISFWELLELDPDTEYTYLSIHPSKVLDPQPNEFSAGLLYKRELDRTSQAKRFPC